MKTALILPGGGVRGAFEVGAIQAIFNKIVPDVYIGTSIGSINLAVLLAPGNIYKNVDILTENWYAAKRNDFFTLNPFIFDLFHAKSFFSMTTLRKFIKKVTSVDKIEQLQKKVYINALRMMDGKNVFFSEGNLVDSVAASCALPPFYSPVTIDRTSYIDGGMGEALGLRQALRLGCKQIILVNISESVAPKKTVGNIAEISNHTINMMRSSQIAQEIRAVGKKDIIEIKLKGKNQRKFDDFDYKDTLVDLGYKEGKRILSKIKK